MPKIIVMAYIVMAYIVLAYRAMAYIVMAYRVMAYIVMATYWKHEPLCRSSIAALKIRSSLESRGVVASYSPSHSSSPAVFRRACRRGYRRVHR